MPVKKAQYLGFLMKVAGNPATCHSLAMLPAVAPAVAPSMESSGSRQIGRKPNGRKLPNTIASSSSVGSTC